MSDEPEDKKQTDDLPEAYTSPLRMLLSEMHEVYQELLAVGFPDRAATVIVAHMIQDVMLYGASDTSDDENDEQDYNDDSGTL